MLEEAVASLKAGIVEPVADRWSPQITIGTPVLIPEDYVADLPVRLNLYRRLADLEDEREIDAFGAEMADRFGPLPDEVKHLLATVVLKALCRRANVAKIEAGPKGAVISFRDDRFSNPEGLIAFIREQGRDAKVRPDMKLVLFDAWEKPLDRLKGTTAILRRLVRIAERTKAA
jgi:transcription-repair coupling factor (superfamily II helicase)